MIRIEVKLANLSPNRLSVNVIARIKASDANASPNSSATSSHRKCMSPPFFTNRITPSMINLPTYKMETGMADRVIRSTTSSAISRGLVRQTSPKKRGKLPIAWIRCFQVRGVSAGFVVAFFMRKTAKVPLRKILPLQSISLWCKFGHMNRLLLVVLLAASSRCLLAQTSPAALPFMNPDLPVQQRVDDLVSRMTLEEKIGQMMNAAPAIPRLGVPEYNWWNECLHGVARAGLATVFPQAIGLAASWDEDFQFRIATAISDEARAKHHDFVRKGKRLIYEGLTFWSPNINIFRDPRWEIGRAHV